MAQAIRRFAKYRASSDAERRRMLLSGPQLELFPSPGVDGQRPTFFAAVDRLVEGCGEEFQLVAALLERAGWRLLGEHGGWWKAARHSDGHVVRGLGAASLMAGVCRLEDGEALQQLSLPLAIQVPQQRT